MGHLGSMANGLVCYCALDHYSYTAIAHYNSMIVEYSYYIKCYGLSNNYIMYILTS